LQTDTQHELEQTGIPRSVLRHLIASPPLSVGSSILDAGCGKGELAGYLARLGFEVAGLDDSPESITAARRLRRNVEFHCGSAAAVPFPVHQFDLVLVRRLATHRGSLFSNAALRATAQLLSCVRPGGRLVLLERTQMNDVGDVSGHGEYCVSRHLGCFLGHVHVGGFRDTAPQHSGWKYWLERAERAAYLVATLECPPEPHSRIEWLRMAEDSAAENYGPCCAWAADAGRRAAA